MELLLALLAQANEPFSFRFVVQPIMALLLGLRDARLDAKAGSRPYLLSLFERGQPARTRLKEGMRAVALPFAIAVVLDGVVQLLAGDRVRLWHAVVIGILLIGLPYVLARGLGNRALSARRKRRAAG
ncbi:hypothetical protein [Vulgatibacter sp.]|uniref:hypothetical protein n=1 Tax=Vulgatibacter sp. TaxID=1971226 RepID=UPI003566E30C